MIDVKTEHLLTLSAAGRRLGKHRGTIRAWIMSGRLDGIEVAGQPHTSIEALERASRAVGVVDLGPTPKQLSRATAEAHEAAQAGLRAAGIG